ncbi:MAG: hypothetical protein ACLR5T_05445 [Veillonella sp.]
MPKHILYQWYGQQDVEEIHRKQRYLKSLINNRNISYITMMAILATWRLPCSWDVDYLKPCKPGKQVVNLMAGLSSSTMKLG